MMPVTKWLSGPFRIAVLIVLWIAALGTGFGMLWHYAATPGIASESPVQWPEDSQITRISRRPTLIMFAHPKCPCTRASIAELERIMAQCPGRVTVHVLFERPAGMPLDWAKTGLWDAAADIPGVSVEADENSSEAHRFAAKTSGFALLYGADGRLLFHGGITGSRGHEGDNAGHSAVVDLITTGTSPLNQTAVFGCLLCSQQEDSNDE